MLEDFYVIRPYFAEQVNFKINFRFTFSNFFLIQDLVEGSIYNLSKFRKISSSNSFYYIATVNNQHRLNMSTDVSSKIEHTALVNNFSEPQMLSLHLKMRAVQKYSAELGIMCMSLVIVGISTLGLVIESKLDSDDDSDSDDTEVDLENCGPDNSST